MRSSSFVSRHLPIYCVLLCERRVGVVISRQE
jgi:hypothetical protein